ncbi:ribulose 1,5-bisphosphate carboxylase large subunit [Pseudactinotalea sp. HY160]|uniref:RuBisCO large subunit C-terminal-like domain-containing protein n=1 Tax=Pseudactinotalea sp. HY160 TaxID=2654490 RepID=UPI00128E834A|nr:ribulose 1,5-bisphosphate carboxylase large subunit [Pseudactinotalea sp. HY160]
MLTDPERLYVTYRLGSADLSGTIEAIRVEQTIEFPHDLAREWIRETLVGRVEEVAGDRVTFSYDPRILEADGAVTQFLNVVWGNVSLMDDVRVVSIEPPRTLLDSLPGPRFGTFGVRRLVGAAERPLLMTALKPMGMPAPELAAHAGLLAGAGIDVIKDDHGLADQPWARWRERLVRCAEAVAEANERTGRSALYAPSLNVPLDRVVDCAHAAREAGAGALLALPGLSSFEMVRVLASDPSIGLPVISHPAGLGSLTARGSHGFEPGLIYGLLNRLCGADLCVFVSHGGRFGPSAAECERIRDECRRPLGTVETSMPVPGGGMSIERVGALYDTYGADAAYLVGGALHRGDLRTNASALRGAVERLATQA